MLGLRHFFGGLHWFFWRDLAVMKKTPPKNGGVF